MTALAVSYGWAFGLRDWQIGEALGLSENRVRCIRRALGLKKGAGGMPIG